MTSSLAACARADKTNYRTGQQICSATDGANCPEGHPYGPIRGTDTAARIHQDAGCAVCERSTSSTTYVQWGRQSCSNNDHQLEYFGVVMANRLDYSSRSTFICVDKDMHPTTMAYAHNVDNNRQGAHLFTAQFEASGQSTYVEHNEVGCAVCCVLSDVHP
jgi:hypothetical protein